MTGNITHTLILTLSSTSECKQAHEQINTVSRNNVILRNDTRIFHFKVSILCVGYVLPLKQSKQKGSNPCDCDPLCLSCKTCVHMTDSFFHCLCCLKIACKSIYAFQLLFIYLLSVNLF